MRILIVDDRWEVRAGLRALLEQEPDVSVVDEAVDLDGLLAKTTNTQPDAILLDWGFDTMSGSETLGRLRPLCPQARIIVLSVRQEVRDLAFECGADGFVLKGDLAETVLAEIRG
ncbi:MAG: response regulator transcription factor [Firmicutes bacterium]|nr:response regulator transcription factor [Bacillota bacterium]MDD4336474.1 response regulator transcription factor [Bacillota bacterium]MDD4791753.1 response regulator transcription factor [Bacillota bacterium]